MPLRTLRRRQPRASPAPPSTCWKPAIKYSDCIQACLECFADCQRCLALMAGHASDNECPACCVDCSAACLACVSLLASEGPFSKEACELCVKACERCAQNCAEHAHEHCQKCADSSRRCAEACRSMAT